MNNAPSRKDAAEAKEPNQPEPESVAAPETRSALIQFAADVIRLRTNGEPLKVRESEALDSRLCDLGMAMRAEADRITAAIRGSVAAPVAAQPDLTALLREARDALEYHQEQTRPIVRTETAIARIDALLPRSEGERFPDLAGRSEGVGPSSLGLDSSPLGMRSTQDVALEAGRALLAEPVSAPPAEPVAQPAKYVPLTMEAIWDAADEAGLDWHMGFSIGDDTQEDNRYAKLVRAVESAVVQRMQGASPPAVSADAPDAARWCVNVWGPDDVYAMPSRAAALERANEMNIAFGKTPRHEYDPIMLAVVIEWPHSAESHRASMAGTTPAGKENGK